MKAGRPTVGAAVLCTAVLAVAVVVVLLMQSGVVQSAWSEIAGILRGGSEGPGSQPVLVLSIALFLFVFVSEDLSCIAAGLLAANGSLPLPAAVFACFLGIWVSDVGLYLLGRFAGPRVLEWRAVRRVVAVEVEERARAAYARNGAQVVFITRFLPGSRVAAYLTAGALRLGLVRFSAWLLLAAGLWTPVLVGCAYWIGRPLIAWWERSGWYAVPAVGLALVAFYLAVKFAARLLTHRGRRELLGLWLRWRHWEFWPAWLFYAPVVAWVALLALRHRSLTLWAASNPAIEPAGGLAMESKSAILGRLDAGTGRVADWELLPAGPPVDQRVAAVRRLQQTFDAPWPVVLKPDIGQRGEGVAVIDTEDDLGRYFAACPEPVIAQAYAPGRELGVFYYRYPGEAAGALFSITEKVLPEVEGDGQRTLEDLILDDPRAVALARHYLHANAHRLGSVPEEGRRVRLVELGTHCRGAVFLDGEQWMSDRLCRDLDAVVAGYDGFCFGRFDLKFDGDDPADGFRIIELNGVSSESTDIYDPSNSVFHAWRKLARQWALAFEIGRRNRGRGAPVPAVGEILRVIREHRRRKPFDVHAAGL